MIFLILCSCFLITSASPIPGFYHDFGHSLFENHLYSSPIIKTLTPAPLLSHVPIYKAYTTPIYEPVPIWKAIVPATSYATVSSYHIAHAPVLKTVIAAPSLLKTYAPSLSYGYH